MNYLKHALTILLVCVLLQILGIVNFSQLLLISPDIWVSTLLPCTLFLLTVNTLAAVRWVLTVNRFLSTRIELINGIAVTFKAGLLSYFLPGQLASELGRVILASRGKGQIDRDFALSSAIIDRGIALLSMVVMTLIALTFVLIDRYQTLSLFLFIGGALLLIALILYLAMNAIKFFSLRYKRYRYVDYVANILKIVLTFAVDHPRFCCIIVVYSMVLNMMVATVIYLIVSEVIFPMDFMTVTLMTLVSNLSSVIPITPGGVGITEIVFQQTGEFLHAGVVKNLAGGYIVFRVLNMASFIVGTIIIETWGSVSSKD